MLNPEFPFNDIIVVAIEHSENRIITLFGLFEYEIGPGEGHSS